MSGRILVVGYGNPMMGDDGAGPAVLERLREMDPPTWVRIVEGHTDALNLRAAWSGESEVLLVDALCSGRPVGTVHVVSNDELLAAPQPHATAHALSLPESIRWLRLVYPELEAVRFRLWGIEVRHARLGEGLSEPVKQGVREAAAAIAALWS